MATAAGPASGPLGATVARGALWTIGAAGANKVVTLGGQFALAWLLVPEDFGVAAMALSVGALTTVLSSYHLGFVLIQRRVRIRENAGQVFWLALALGMTAGILLAFLAPLGARILGEPRVVPLILVVAVASPVQAFSVVFSAALSQDLRFRAISLTNFGSGLLYTGLAVVLAATGSGAMALVLPILAQAIYSAIVMRALTGPVVLGRPLPRRWPTFLAPAFLLMVSTAFEAIRTQGTPLVIGAIHGPSVTGLFSWGFAMATQAVFLVAASLMGVFFPSLAKLNEEPRRQAQAFLRASRMLLLITGFVCSLQFLAAPWFVETLFEPKWHASVTVVRTASLGLLFQPMAVLTTALLLARERNRPLVLLSAGMASMALLGALAGAVMGGVGEIALAVSLAFAAGNVLAGAVGYASIGAAPWSMVMDVARMGAPAAGALVTGQVVQMLAPADGGVIVPALSVILGVCAFYVVGRQVCPDELRTLRESLVRVVRPSREVRTGLRGIERSRA